MTKGRGDSTAGHTPPPERSMEDEQGARAEPALQLGEPPIAEAKGERTTGGGDSAAGHTPPTKRSREDEQGAGAEPAEHPQAKKSPKRAMLQDRA
jgi:hypothetical protein